MPADNRYVDAVTLPYGSARSITEIFSNTPIIQENFSEDEIKDLIGGKLPQRSLLKFTHEYAHYWCFASFFGLSHRTFSSSKHTERVGVNGDRSTVAGRFSASGGHPQDACCRCPRRSRSYMEFDIWPQVGEHPVAPVAWAVRCFEHQDCPDPLLSPVAQLLFRTVRSDESAVERKADLLLHPLRYDLAGYLVGYLALKEIWRNLIRRDRSASTQAINSSPLSKTISTMISGSSRSHSPILKMSMKRSIGSKAISNGDWRPCRRVIWMRPLNDMTGDDLRLMLGWIRRETFFFLPIFPASPRPKRSPA